MLLIDIEDAPGKLAISINSYKQTSRNLKVKISGVRCDLGSPPCRNFTKLPDHWINKDGRTGRWKHLKTRKKVYELLILS